MVLSLGPQLVEGEHVFGVCHIFASFSDSFVHVIDVFAKESICCVTGGLKAKADLDEPLTLCYNVGCLGCVP